MHYLHVKTNYNILTSKRKLYRKKQYVPRHLPKINRVTVPENPEWSIIFLPNGPIWMLVERISPALLLHQARPSPSVWMESYQLLPPTRCQDTDTDSDWSLSPQQCSGVSALNTWGTHLPCRFCRIIQTQAQAKSHKNGGKNGWKNC